MRLKNPNWRVFPCVSWANDDPAKPPAKRGKAPLTPNGLYDASNDPAVIAAWQEQFPGCNWGLPTGLNGLAVVDLDSAAAEEAWFDLQLERGQVDNTYVVNTPRGKHLYFEGEIKNTAGTDKTGLAAGIDTRGEGGYVMLPGSFVNGITYTEENPDAPIAKLPAWVLAASGRKHSTAQAIEGFLFDAPQNVARAKACLANYVATGRVATQGKGGDNQTYAVAAEVLNFGISADVALDLLCELWNPHCIPPWTRDELAVKIGNASQYAQNEAGSWAVLPAAERIPALDKLLQDSRSAPEAPTRFKWMDEDEFKFYPPPVWLLKDRLMRNSIAMLYGPSGHYKSFLALNMAGEVAQMGECAFYVAAEGIARMAVKDYPAWKLAYAEERKLPLYMTDEMPKIFNGQTDYDAFADSIKAKAEGRPVGIIFLDTLNRAMSGLNDNDARDASQMVEAAEALKRTFQCCVVLVHHTPKYDKETWRGSGVFYNDFDTVLAVHANHDTKLVSIKVTKQKTDEACPKPFWYEGKRYGAGLAFVPVEARAVALLADEADIYGAKTISRTLVKLNAFDPRRVRSHVLAQALTVRMESDTDETWNMMVARTEKGLASAVKKGKLSGYCEGEGRAREWFLPSNHNSEGQPEAAP